MFRVGRTIAAICGPVHDGILVITEGKMKKTFLALAMIGAMAFSLTAYGGETEATGNTESTGATAMAATGAEDVGAAPDYSKSECWYRIPEITKDDLLRMRRRPVKPRFATLVLTPRWILLVGRS